MIKKLILLFFSLFIIVGLFGNNSLIILHTNDHHGRPLAYPCTDLPGGGLPARKILIDQIRKDNPNVLVLDAGDINDGLVESDNFEAEPDIKGYNLIGYDAMTLGNHEFYHSLDRLDKQKMMLQFPILCANISNVNNKPMGLPYIIKTMPNGLRVGIIGLTTNSAKYSAPKNTAEQLIFQDEVKAAKECVALIKDKTDLIIALTHLGIYDGGDTLTYGSLRVAKEVPEIDAVIDGHSHTYLKAPIWMHQADGDSIPVVQALCWGMYLGKLELSVNNGKTKFQKWECIPINANEKGKYYAEKIPEDKGLLALLTPYKTQIDKLMGEVIGTSDKRYEMSLVRKGDCELAQLVANALMWYSRYDELDFAMTNGGGIRADLPAGQIKLSDIYNILPFPNSIVVMDLEGAKIKQFIEYCMKKKIGTGGYLQFSKEVQIYLDKDNNVTKVTISGIELDPSHMYRFATNSYLADGGDGFSVISEGIVFNETEEVQRESLVQYIKGELKGKIQLQLQTIIKK